MKKIVSLLLISMLTVGSLAGCGSKPASNAPAASNPPAAAAQTQAAAETKSGEDAKAGTETRDTVTFGYVAEPSDIAPWENNEGAAYYPAFLIYSNLFKYGPNGPEPDLVTEYHTEKDSEGKETIWVFKIREGVKFSDGTDLTSEDIADSLNYALTRPAIGGLVNFFNKVEADGDYTVKMYTNGVYATAPAALCNKACAIVPSELLAAGHDFANNPIGSGPYKLVKWNKGENMTFTINENYFNKEHFPTIQNINWRFIAESNSRSISVEAKEIDFAINVGELDIPRLEADPGLNVSITSGSYFLYMCLQAQKAPFNDINFRKFLACAINRDDIVTVACNGYANPLVGCININFPGTTDEGAESYDPEKAKEYLAAWGGDPGTVTFDILASNDQRRRAAEVIQSNLSEYGITTTITMTETATCSLVAKSGEYDAMVFAYTTNDFPTFVKNLYYVSDDVHPGNKFRMSGDDSLNSVIDDINTTIDEEARLKKITEFGKQLNARQPVVPLFNTFNVNVYNKDLTGVTFDPQGYFRVEDFRWN